MPFRLSLLVNLLIYAGCFSGLILQISNLIERYSKRHTQVSQTEVPKTDIRFPAITICVDYWTSKAKLCELHKNNCTKRGMMYVTMLYQQHIDFELRNKTAFDPEVLFSCQLKGSGSCNLNEDCASTFKLTSYRRPLQMCYTLNLENNPKFHCQEPWFLEVSLSTAIKAKDTIIFMRTQTVPVILVQPGVSPMLEIPSLELKPGYAHEVTIRQQNIKRLPAPFESNCFDYEPMGHQFDMKGKHSMESCVQQCLYRAEMAHCGCITLTHEFGGSIPLPICLDINAGFEYCNRLVMETPAYQKCYDYCGVPCKETRYDVKLARIAPIPNVKTADKESTFQVKFRFATFNVEVLEVFPLINFEALMAYMGGSFGVWIGVSLIDALTWLLDHVHMVFSKINPLKGPKTPHGRVQGQNLLQ